VERHPAQWRTFELNRPLASEPVFMAATPSDHRWHLSVTAWMRRVMPAEQKVERRVEQRVTRKPSTVPRPAPLRGYGSPRMLHRLPEPDRRGYPPEPPPGPRFAGGPVGYVTTRWR
jgi:hypothetical protein